MLLIEEMQSQEKDWNRAGILQGRKSNHNITYKFPYWQLRRNIEFDQYCLGRSTKRKHLKADDGKVNLRRGNGKL